MPKLQDSDFFEVRTNHYRIIDVKESIECQDNTP
jgi:hypothetical protein